MYLASLEIRNLRCFAEAKLEFPARPGWNVILGGNGQGKSTLLQAAALAMLGPEAAAELVHRDARRGMVRRGAEKGEVSAVFREDIKDTPVLLHILEEGRFLPLIETGGSKHWFSAGYGPYRRLTGAGGEQDEMLARSSGGEGRHLTLFRESAALILCEGWLTRLYASSLDEEGLGLKAANHLKARLAQVKRLINRLLPSNVQLHSITTEKVTFQRGDGTNVRLSDLSDGYRSFLALIVDLLSHVLNDRIQLVSAQDDNWLNVSGVVLIDEADAHLHPEWQRALGGMLCSVFPNIQFIVTSHSAFIAQAAQPGGIFVLHSGPDGTVQVTREQGAVSGWTVDQILLSPLFGLHSTRGPEIERLINRRQVLLGRSSRTSLEDEELRGLTENLRKQMSAPGDSLEERDLNQKMMDYVRTRIGDMA